MGWFDSIAEAFSRDGSVTRIAEKLPVVGTFTACIQGIAGNEDHAKRALATSTNSLITTAGAVGGFFIAGPPGAVAGAALGSTAGIAVEHGLSTDIKDSNVKGDVGDMSLKRFVVDAAFAGSTAVIGGGGGGAIAKQVGVGVSKEAGKAFAGSVVKTAATTIIGEAAR